MFKKVTNVSAVTKTLFSPASNLLDLASSNLEGAYDALVEDRLKSTRRNNRVRLPRNLMKCFKILLHGCGGATSPASHNKFFDA